MAVRQLTPDIVAHPGAQLGEGPLWDGSRQRLLWVDIPRRAILITDPATGNTNSIPTPSDVGAVVLTESGDYVAALRDGLYTSSGDSPWQLLAPIEASDQTTRMNDGKCDPFGNYVGGTIAHGAADGAASLYRVDATGNTQRLLGGVTISNGLDWSDDGMTLFYIDTPTRTVVAYAYDHTSPTLGQPRSVVEVPERDGFPDGMTLDSEGCLWVGLWGGRAVRRYTPDGTLDTIIDLPVTNVTSCAFGGDDLNTLFITTATLDEDEGDTAAEPLAGALFAVDAGVTGRPATAFGSSGRPT